VFGCFSEAVKQPQLLTCFHSSGLCDKHTSSRLQY